MRLFLFAGLMLASSAAAVAEDFTINVGTDERNGVCFVYFPREDGLELALSLRPKDGNVNVQINDIPSDWVDGNEEKDIKLAIKPDKGFPITTDGGAYVAGFNYRAQGWFDRPGTAKGLLTALKGGKSFTVSFDGHDVGTFAIQQQTGSIKDYAYSFMQGCAERNGGSSSF